MGFPTKMGTDERDILEDALKEGVPEVNTEQLFSNSMLASYVIWKDSGGTIYGDAQVSGLPNYEDADAATVIQNCIDQLGGGATPGNGGVIFFKRGNYEISKTINIKGLQTLIGEAVNSTQLKLADGANCNMLDFSGDTDEAWFNLMRMRLHGNYLNNTAGRGLHIDPAAGGRFRDIRIKDVYISHFQEHGILTYDNWGWELVNLVVEQIQGTGLSMQGGRNLKILGGKISANGGHGIYLVDTENAVVLGTEVEGNDLYGIRTDADGVILNGLIVKGNSRNTANSYDGILLYETSGCRVIGCRIDGEYQGTNYHRYGINTISAVSTDNIIERNSIINSVSGRINDPGTRTVINGIGKNGANDPASAGDWNGNGYEGVKVLWDDGVNYFISTYSGGVWYDVQVDSPVV